MRTAPSRRRRTDHSRDSSAVRWRRSFGQLVFPGSCCLCEGVLEDPLRNPACPECIEALRPYVAPMCPRCGLFFAPSATAGLCGECRARRRPFRMAVAAAPYEGVFRSALLELKFRRREVLARLLAEPAVSAFRRAPRGPEAGTAGTLPVAAVAVPLPFWRSCRRGFNQAELLARPIARELGIPLVRGVLHRRTRPPQTLVTPSARRRKRAGRLPGAPAARRTGRPAPPAG